MSDQSASNTGEKQVKKPGTFTKGDPRINRKGRPKSFDALRALAQTIANEPAVNGQGVPIVVDDHIATQAEMILRAMMKDNPERFVEIAYGKVPNPVEVSGKDGGPIETKDVSLTDDERSARVVALLERARARATGQSDKAEGE